MLRAMVERRDRLLRTVALSLEGAVFTVLVPGSVAGWIPRWILGPERWRLPTDWSPLAVIAIVVAGIGVSIYLWCLWDFVTRGRGIPAPLDHPTELVVSGLYRYVRNPMYIGVLIVLLAESAFFRSPTLLVYAGGFFLFVNLAVMFFEEPLLRRKFGPTYERYTNRVGRWVPRRPSGHPGR